MLNHHIELAHERNRCTMRSSLSPKSRRRAEFTIKQLQNGVVGRARSTITSLTDIWKSKVDAKANKITSPTATRRTLDILNVWSRQRRSASSTRTSSDFDCKNDVFAHRNGRNSRDEIGYSNANCLNEMNGMKKFNEKHQFMNENTNKLPSPQRIKNKYLSRFSRNKSFEIDDLLDERKSRTKSNEMVECQLSDGDLNNLYETKRKNSHKLLYISQSDENIDFVQPKYRENGKMINLRATGNTQTIVKARLKFQKVKANDDIVLNRTTELVKPKLLTRQHSAVPLLRVSSFDDKHIGRVPSIFKSSMHVDGTEEKQKPRKKLSFREPIATDAKIEKYKTKLQNVAEQKPTVEVNFDELNEIELEVPINRENMKSKLLFFLLIDFD